MAASSRTSTLFTEQEKTSTAVERHGSYVCIECGKEASELYRYYSSNVLKISHCGYCDKIVDKYIEFDPVIILLDAVLHKQQAYRHILYNSLINVHWKLCVLCLLCDAYVKWTQLKEQNADGTKDFLYYALEWDYYAMFFIAGLEFVCFILGVVLSCKLYQKFTTNTMLTPSTSMQVRALMLSNSGKLLVLPAVIWGASSSILLRWITTVFVFTSSIQSLQVLFQSHTVVNCILVLCGYGVQICIEQWISPALQLFLTNT
ncbi:protein ARV1-like [Saccoglossus kowalevskii]|uniref:Protein ARV n=1 Tax=Saccoglossus kowalevskii TaxID=10224 RepID=A0ABM0MBP0_SACKO|nr:PREDICTED: protein ARV1-like [Saccoglossus kowalevskii]